MNRFFYTFGSDERFPFQGGWVEVQAENLLEAHKIFRSYYPDRTPGCLNCSDYYTEFIFNAENFPAEGNRGRFCHRILADKQLTTTKTNGYKAETIQDMIQKFEKAARKLFPGCTIRHFYYGDYLDMADIVLKPGEYAHFNVRADRVSMNGYTCRGEDLCMFGSLTYNDECYEGKLLEIASK